MNGENRDRGESGKNGETSVKDFPITEQDFPTTAGVSGETDFVSRSGSRDGAAFREALKRGPVLFDGAMGTYYAALYGHTPDWCDMAGLNRPEEIASIHRSYLDAGCQAIKTNTFSVSRYLAQGSADLARRILEAGCRIAREAADPRGAFVFADIGPAPSDFYAASVADAEQDGDGASLPFADGASLLFLASARHAARPALSPAEIYCKQADAFLEQGVTCFLAETLPSDEGLPELARHLKERCPEAFLIVSFAVGADGMTREGWSAGDLLRRAASWGGVDGAGFNCVSGPEHLLQVIRGLEPSGIPLSVMPNAGYPGILGRHTVFQGQPDYFGEKLRQIAEAGARIVGGCCGTTPAHIAAASIALRSLDVSAVRTERREPPVPTEREDPFGDKLNAGQRVIAVELDPPADDDASFFLEGAVRLRDAGADIVTIADCPVGRARADSSLMACLLRREGVEPLPHMTCRDRNLNATKALLLGLSMAGVRNVLLVTGDPIPTESRDEVKAVFNFNSRKLARYVGSLPGTALRTPFRLFGALNVNARNFEAQLKAAQEKEACGMAGFLTQPVLSPEGLENLKRAREVLTGKLLGGIFPVVSYRNACFLNNEVAGIRVSEEIAARYEGKSREEGEKLALELSVRTAEDVAPWTDGLYIVTPFRRVALMERILAAVTGRHGTE